MNIGAAIALVVIIGLYVGLELGLVAVLKAMFRRLSAKVERRDHIALGLPADEKRDQP
jgi:Flp pilus assembly pilin Flp